MVRNFKDVMPYVAVLCAYLTSPYYLFMQLVRKSSRPCICVRWYSTLGKKKTSKENLLWIEYNSATKTSCISENIWYFYKSVWWEIATGKLEEDLKWSLKIHRWRWTADSMDNSTAQKLFLIIFIANIFFIQAIKYILNSSLLSTACSN